MRGLQKRCSPLRLSSAQPPATSRRHAAAVLAVLASTGTVAAAQDVLVNPGFEAGVAPWFPTGTASLTLSPDARSGATSLLVSGRTNGWNAANQNILLTFQGARTYEFAAWVKLLQPSSAPVALTLRIEDAQGLRFVRVAQSDLDVGVWQRVADFARVPVTPPVTTVQFYIEGPPAGVSYLVDDATVRAIDTYDWRASAQAGIEANRMDDLRVVVVDQDGLPRPGASVAVAQRSRGFRFGSAVAAPELGNPQYREYFLERFNMATPENAWKWEANEFARDFEFYRDADIFRDFCLDNNIRIHGHNVLWAVQEFVPDWVQQLPAADLPGEVTERVRSIVTRYRGLVDAWDVNNEMLHGSFFADRLGPGFRPQLFVDVAALDPAPPLYVNDYNILTGTLTEAYLRQIEELRAAGAPIGGIGVQGHYNQQPLDPFVLRAKLDRLAQAGLPVRITEYDYVRTGASDLERADALEAMYRVSFSHPSVEAVSLWGFWAGRHWRGPQAALVDLNWVQNAVGDRLDALLSEWWTAETAQTNAEGVAVVRAFHGEHDITVTAADGAAADVVRVALVEGGGAVEVRVELAIAPCNAADLAPPRGVLGTEDVLALLATVASGDAAADLDGDGEPTMLDVLAGLASYDVGCP